LELALSMGNGDPAERRSRRNMAPPSWEAKRPCPEDVTDYRSDAHDRAVLEQHGWVVRNPFEVAGSPESYREYVQASRGEFSCAKPSCMQLENAWVSDRSLCYLASGRPVVLQNTGPSSFL